MTRDYGEGSIYRRKDGRFEGKLRNHGKRVSVYGATYREAKAKLKLERGKREAGIIPSGKQTVGAFLDRWLTDVVEPTVEKTTYASYRQQVQTHLLPELGREPLDKLNPQAVQRLLNQLAHDGLSPRTVEYVRAVGRRAFNVAIKWQMVNRNPFALVEIEHPKRGRVAHFTADEAVRLLTVTRGTRAYPIYVMALTTGMRQGELFGLRWADIDWTVSTLQVRAALKRTEGDVWLGTPKTEQSQATLPLAPLALRALAQWREEQAQDRHQAGPPFAGLVFTTPHGLPLRGRNFTQRTYYPMLEQAGLPRIPFRNLRHSCATLLLSLGVDIKVIQTVLRHSKIGTTAEFYTSVNLSLMRGATDALDRLLGG